MGAAALVSTIRGKGQAPGGLSPHLGLKGKRREQIL